MAGLQPAVGNPNVSDAPAFPGFKEERKMFADNFNYQVAAGLHRDRLNEAESIRRAEAAKRAAKAVKAEKASGRNTAKPERVLRRKIGRQLIALGERMTA